MTKRKKRFTFSVTMSVPSWMTASQARREVRTLLNEQSFYMDHGPEFEGVDETTIKAVSVSKSMREPMELRLCEQRHTIFQPNRAYVFTVDPTCPLCCAMATAGANFKAD